MFPLSDSAATTSRATTTTARRYMPKAVVINPYFDWGGDRPPRRPLARDGRSTRPTSRASRAAIPTSPRTCAAPTPGSRTPPSIEHLTSARRHRRRAAAGPPVRPRQHLLDKGLRNYWGYNSIGFFAPHNEYSAARQRRASRSQEFKEMVQDAARGRHRGDPRRRLQPHGRGQPPRPDAVVQGHRQRRLLPAGRRRPALLLRLHGHRQHAEHAPPARAAADHGLPALLGRRRCTSTASASTSPPALARELHEVDRLSAFFDLDPAGPGRSARSS